MRWMQQSHVVDNFSPSHKPPPVASHPRLPVINIREGSDSTCSGDLGQAGGQSELPLQFQISSDSSLAWNQGRGCGALLRKNGVVLTW